MSLSLRELEDDIIIAHNEVRRNPRILIHELENILDEKKPYYTPSTHLATLIGEHDLKDIVSFANTSLILLIRTYLSSKAV